EIDLGIGRNGAGVGKAVAQAAAVNHRCTESGALPQIGGAGRCGQELGVVGVDVVVGDVVELGGIEQILVRHHVGGDLSGPGQVSIKMQIPVGVGGLEFDALIDAARVVEGGQHIGLAELSVVKQVGRGLVVGVEPDLEPRHRVYFLNDADIEHVGAFRQHRI